MRLAILMPLVGLTRAITVLSIAVIALGALASAIGLLVPGFYARDPPALAPQMVGQDLVTLALVVPLLVVALVAARRGSARGIAGLAGGLLYVAYTYATYAFGARFNVLFLVYVALLGASTYALFLVVPRLVALPVAPEALARAPRRSLVAFLAFCVAAFVLLWGADIVPALLGGGTPRAALEAQTPTSPIHVLDLAFALPLLALAAVLLLRRRPVGLPIAAMALVKAGTIAAAVLSMAAFAWRAGEPVDAPVAGAVAIILTASLALAWGTFRALLPATLPTPTARPRPAAPPLR